MIILNIKFIEIFSTFSEKDWDNLILYTKSSDAISERRYLPLVLELKNFKAKLPELKKTPASEIFEKAYKRTFSTHTVSNRQSELLNLLKKFLENNSYKKDELIGTYFYFEELISRNLQNIFPGEFKKKKDLLENNYLNDDSYKYLSQILFKNAQFFELKSEKDNCFNAFFEYSKVLLSDILCNLYETGQVIQIFKYYNVKNKFDPMLKFIDSIASEKYFEELEEQNEPVFIIPLIRFYIFKSFQHPDCKKYISNVKKIYFANEEKFTDNFKVQVYNMISTYYNVKVNKGEIKYFKDIFSLYKKKLKQNLVSDMMGNRSINANVFREYIIAGLQVKQFKWVEMIIKKYSPLIPENIREDERVLAMIRLYFEKKEFEKVIETASNAKIKSTIHYLDSVRINLASLYELKRYEDCFMGIDRTKHFLKNNKEKTTGIAYNLKQYQDFIDIFLKLLNYCTNPFNKDINSLLYDIEKSNTMMKDWISEKLKELLKYKSS